MDQKLREHLRNRNETGIQEMYLENQCPHFFAVDWLEDDAHIVEDCAECLPGVALRGEWRDDQLWILYKDKQVQIPLIQDGADRGITIATLNDVLAPENEIRLVVCSHGGDTLTFAVLPASDWKTLEQESPKSVEENFLELAGLPNVFTKLTEKDMPQAARALIDRMMARHLKKRTSGGALWWAWVLVTTVVLIAVYFWWSNSVAK